MEDILGNALKLEFFVSCNVVFCITVSYLQVCPWHRCIFEEEQELETLVESLDKTAWGTNVDSTEKDQTDDK